MFWAIFVVLLVLWAIGLICHVAFSNLLLVIAVIVLVIRLVRRRAPWENWGFRAAGFISPLGVPHHDLWDGNIKMPPSILKYSG